MPTIFPSSSTIILSAWEREAVLCETINKVVSPPIVRSPWRSAASVAKPEILILDDSASALDYATDASLRKAIRELDGKTTVFIVSQRASSIMHADKIIVLDDGCTVGIGTHTELLENCAVYREIYETQFGEVQHG